MESEDRKITGEFYLFRTSNQKWYLKKSKKILVLRFFSAPSNGEAWNGCWFSEPLAFPNSESPRLPEKHLWSWKAQIIVGKDGNQLEDLGYFFSPYTPTPPQKKIGYQRGRFDTTPPIKNDKKSHRRFYAQALICSLFFLGGRWDPWEAWSLRCSSWKGENFWRDKHRLVQYMDPGLKVEVL